MIEKHYVRERGLSPAKTVDYLTDNYLDHGKLGTKSNNGGLYPVDRFDDPNASRIIVLDIGAAAATPSVKSGQILEFSPDGRFRRILVPEQSFPDGIVVDPPSADRRMFWTNMGRAGQKDGAVYSAKLDGSDIQTIVPHLNTPKQITMGRGKLYFTDREGGRIYRCSRDGSDLELLVSTSTEVDKTDPSTAAERISDATKWCVGMAVSPELGKFYWTQKGHPKSGEGRIFCANIDATDSSPTARDIHCIYSDLPEPIDLEIHKSAAGEYTLYWTDRGEQPFGNSLNRIRLDPTSGLPAAGEKYEVLTRNLNEAIGLTKPDSENDRIYMTDLGGSIYQCNLLGGKKETLFSAEYRAFTGIAFL